jgi:hypothetical protein
VRARDPDRPPSAARRSLSPRRPLPLSSEDPQAPSSRLSTVTEGDGSFVPRLIRESGHHREIAGVLLTVIHTRRLAYHRILRRAIARHELDPDVDQDVIIDL